MQRIEFERGWLLLLNQPYATAYVQDDARERLQANLLWEVIAPFEGHVWQAVVRWWLAHQDHFPSISEMVAELSRRVRSATQQVRLGDLRQLAQAPAQAEAEPWISVMRVWAARWPEGGGVRRVGLPILRTWLATHPQDFDVRQTVAEWEADLARNPSAGAMTMTQATQRNKEDHHE